MPRRWWRHLTWAAGGVECTIGVLICSGAYPAAGGASMAVLGAIFCALLGYVLVKRIPGGCGCIRWREPAETAADPVTWGSVARGALLSGAGVANALLRPGASVLSQPAWFVAGFIAGGTALAALSVRRPMRTPICRRPLLRRARAMLGTLAGYETYAAMAASAGPFNPVVRHRRTGCSDEFWFTPADGRPSQTVIFQVNHAVNSPLPAVHVSVRDCRTPEVTWPDRAITMPGRLAGTAPPAGPGRMSASLARAGKPAGNGGGRHEIPADL